MPENDILASVEFRLKALLLVGTLRLTVPLPLEARVICSLAPVDVPFIFTPAPAAAPTTEIPVTADAVLQFACKVGFVIPFGPTAMQFAEVDVIV